MKKRLITKILLLITTVFCAFAFTACIGEMSFEDYRKENEIQSDVYYYANGGTFDSSSSVSKKWLGLSYPDGATTSYAPDITEETEKITVKRTDYIIEGWYYAKLDESGEVVWADEAKTIPVATDVKAEFPLSVEKNKSVYLVAKWKEDVKIEIYLVSDMPVKYTEKDKDGNEVEKSFNNGELIATQNFGRFESIDFSSKTPLVSTNATCLQIYTDAECTQKAGKISKPDDGENVKLYAKYIDGLWTFVRNASDVRKMFRSLNTENNKYYLLDNIDCLTDKGEKLVCQTTTNFKGTIKGNGYTISNIAFSSQESIGNGGKVSALGKLCSTASITDLTLDGIDVTYTVKGDFTNLYALFEDVEENVPSSALQNVKIKNLKLSITNKQDRPINNIPKNDNVYSKNNFLFGGYETDAEFLKKFTEMMVENAELVINNN